MQVMSALAAKICQKESESVLSGDTKINLHHGNTVSALHVSRVSRTSVASTYTERSGFTHKLVGSKE